MKDIVDKVDSASPDEFDRQQFAERISYLLFDKKQQASTGVVVGITGPWGSGKSKAIRMVLQYLEKARAEKSLVILMPFNPWLVSGHETLIGQFYELLWEEISKLSDKLPKEKGLKALGEQLDQMRRRVKPWLGLVGKTLEAADVYGTGRILKEGVDALTGSSSLEQEKDELTDKIKKAKISAIILIDEIDRLSDEDIRQMAKVIKSLADFKEFSYLLAYDPDRVAKALGGTDVKLGHQYLEKIVQVQMRLPRALPRRLRQYVCDKLKPLFLENYYDKENAESVWMNHETTFSEVLESLVPEVISTPRDALRLLAGIQARLPMVQLEVNLVDLIRYCALESKVPFLSDRLQNLVRMVTVDGRRELGRLLDHIKPEAEIIKNILGDYEEDEQLRNLLLLIFPALVSQGPEVIAKDDTSLCYETPLSTLLNCHKHPHSISISEAKNALRDPHANMQKLLSKAFEHDLPRHAILRLRSVASTLELEPDQVRMSWECMGQFFDRELSNEGMGHYRNWLDLTHVWVRGALRNYLSQHPISFEFVNDLIKNKFIHLPARIIFFHMIAHGMKGIQKDSSLKPMITKAKTDELLKNASGMLANEIRCRLVANKWLVKSVVPLWVIRSGNSKVWEDLKETLSDPQSVETLDGLLVLLLRTKGDNTPNPMKGLSKMLDMQKLAQGIHALKDPRQEFRPPVVAAIQYFYSLA